MFVDNLVRRFAAVNYYFFFFKCFSANYLKYLSRKVDLVEREVGRGIRMGNTCKSVADSCQCMTKTTTIFKKRKKNLKHMREN